MGDTTAIWAQPRFSLHRTRLDMVLSLPIWIAMDPQAGLLTDTSDPETWAAFIEHFKMRNRAGNAELYVGSLRAQQFGHGSLVDQYTGRLDPLSPRTGATFRFDKWGIHSQWLVNSIVNPQVMGGYLETTPLRTIGWDKNRRFRLSLGGMLDVGAPVQDHEAVLGSLSLGMSVVAWRSSRLGFELYSNGVAVSGDKLGGHFGLLSEWVKDKRRSKVFTLRTELVLATNGYTPGYFDMAYEAERLGLPGQDQGPKATWKNGNTQHIRMQVNYRAARLQISASTDIRLAGGAKYALVGHYESSQWGVSGMLMQRNIQSVDNVLGWDGQTAAMAEASARLYRDLYGWARLYRGWHEEDGTLSSLTSWSVGIGYGMARLF